MNTPVKVEERHTSKFLLSYSIDGYILVDGGDGSGGGGGGGSGGAVLIEAGELGETDTVHFV